MPRKFEGPLAERMEPRRIYNYLMNEEMLAKIHRSWAKEDWRKLVLLCGVYDVAPDDDIFMNLCFALAKDFVPGFQEKKKTGKKEKWSYSHDSVLLIEVDRLRDEFGYTITAAAALLASREPWKSFIKPRDKFQPMPNPGEVLRRRYSKINKSNFAKSYRDSYKYAVLEGEEDEWESNRRELFERE